MERYNKKIKIIVSIFLIILLGILLYRLFSKKSSISLNSHYVRMYEQEAFQLEASINSDTVDNSKVIWRSENPSVASVTPNGLIISTSVGETRIIVQTSDGKASNSCIVVVISKEIESFELDRKELLLNVGDEISLTPIITPSDLENEKVTWESSDSSIVRVDETGKVQALKNGIAIIKATILGNEANCIVYVGNKISSIQMDKKELELEIGKTASLNVSMIPEDALTEKIIWESSDQDILEIDSKGNITAISIGNAEIVAKTEYSEIKDTCYVTVTKRKYEIKYMELNKTVTIKEGDTLGTLPTITKSGYKLLGWYTTSSGGTKVSSSTIVTTDMTLYPHWEVDYCLPQDSRFNSYNTVVYSDTDTFKYRIIRYGKDDIVLIWVADATKQLKQGLAVANAKGALPAEYILSEVPANKTLVAVNASLFDEGTGSPLNGVIIHDGKVVKNQQGRGGCVGITKDSTLVDCTGQSLDGFLKLGILNNFTISHSIAGGGSDGTKLVAHRTQFCQVDKHNFAIISAYNTKTSEAARVLYNFSGNKCSTIYNLDGGGSRKLYYRTKGGSLTKRFGGDRLIPDMLYFTEQ